MEFIIVSGVGIDARVSSMVSALENAARLCPIDASVRPFRRANAFLATSSSQVLEDDIYAWDGHGVVGDIAFSSGAELSLSRAHIDQYIGGVVDGALQSDMRGVFSCAKFNRKTGAFKLALDPLSQYPIFIFETDEVIVAGNSIYWIEAILSEFDISPQRNANAGAMEALFGIGAGDQTGFDKIKLLPHGYMLEGCGASWRLTPVSKRDYAADHTYEQLLEMSVERLKTYMRALYSTTRGENLLFDLTGGQDSRISLAAAIGSGIPNIMIFSGGDDCDPDKRIAYEIAHRYGLKVGNYPENYNGKTVSHQSLSNTAVFRQQGHSNLYHYDLGTVRLTNVVRVRGGGGELLRYFKALPDKDNRFFKKPLKHFKKLLAGDHVYRAIFKIFFWNIGRAKARLACRWAYEFCMKSNAYQRLFQPRFLSLAVKRVYDELLQSESYGPDMGAGAYLVDRSKRHFGYTSRAFNMSCGVFEPLFDPVLIAAAVRLSNDEREKGRLSFDLIEALGGRELLISPFAEKSLDLNQRTYLSQRLSVAADALTRLPDKLAAPAKATIKTAQNRKYEREFEVLPNGLGMHGKYLWNNRDYFECILSSISDAASCWQVFDKSALLTAIQSDGYFFKNEVAATRGLRIFHTFIWVAEKEEPQGITERL